MGIFFDVAHLSPVMRDDPRDATGTPKRGTDGWGYHRAAVLLLAGILPWGVVTWSNGFYLVFVFGSTRVGFSGFNVLSVPLFAPITPGFTVARAIGALCYLLALGSAVLGRFDLEDRRVTAGLLFLAGVSALQFALELNGQRGILVLPIGVVTLWVAALVAYRGARLRKAAPLVFS